MPVSESDSPEKIEKLEKPPPKAPPQYTAVFADALVAEAKRDPRVIGITAAMAGGTGLNKLCDELPEQYYDVGIAEQDAVLFASGLAIQGAKPVCAIYSTFLQRAFDQFVHDVCLQKLNVVFAMDRAGLVGDDGPTHHGAFDVSYFRPLPNVVVMAPRDEAMLVHMLRTALAYDDGPIAFRYPRGAAEGAPMPDAPKEIEIGKGEFLLPGERVALLGYGYGVQVGLRAAEILREHGLEPTVADARFAKPLDGELIEKLAAEHELLVTIEENVLPGRLRLRRARARRGRIRRRLRARPGPADRPARPLRHPRQARAAARGGRLHRRGGRRARPRRPRHARDRPRLADRMLARRAAAEPRGRASLHAKPAPGRTTWRSRSSTPGLGRTDLGSSRRTRSRAPTSPLLRRPNLGRLGWKSGARRADAGTGATAIVNLEQVLREGNSSYLTSSA